MPDRLTPAEAAAYLRVTPRTLRRYAITYDIPHIRISSSRRGGAKIFYYQHRLDEFLARFETQPFKRTVTA